MAVNLYPHQIKAVEEMKNGSVLKGGVGTGKSIAAVAYFYTKVCRGSIKLNGKGDTGRLKEPRDLFIITTAKKRDDKSWEGECAPFGLSKEREASFGNVQVTIDSWNNIVNYTEVKDAFFIFDEQRLVGSGAWVKAFIKIAKANRWVVLSATPGDNWMDYIPIFVANGFYKNRTQFIRRHVVYNNFAKFPKVDHYVEEGVLLKLRESILVDMPYRRHTRRNISNVLVNYDKIQFERVFRERWHIYEERPIRDVAELFQVMRKLVNTDPERMEKLRVLQRKHKRLIIFYNFNYELDLLRELGPELGIPSTEWNGHRHQEVPEGDEWLYLVQYTAGAEAWNCITTDAIVFYSLNYSYKINEQAKGRIDRLNTPYTDLYYYILRSGSPIDSSIMKAISTKKNFNEREFMTSSVW